MQNGDDEDSEILNKRLAALIRFYREEIVKDCDVRYVVPILLTEFVLEYEDKQIIDKEKTFRTQSIALLDILLEKSKSNVKALVVFKDALKESYPWLYDKLSEDVPDNAPMKNPEPHNNQLMKNSHVPLTKNSLEMGGVKCLPVLAIERKTLLDDIQKQLSDLKRGHFLVLTGLIGCGKTVLATQAVHRTFSEKKNIEFNEVYWLTFGKECSDSKDALLAKMRILCDRLLNSTTSPHSLEHGTELLKGAFLSRPHALLILDNVWSSFVIRHFDVGARTLMTLRDSSLLDVVVGRCNRIHIPQGFDEEESLLLFQKAVNVLDVKELPEEAKDIHKACSGSPMVISLIASLLQDLQVNGWSVDQSRWNYYYEALSKRKYSKMRKDRGYEHHSIYDAISLTYNSLNAKDKALYEHFAIFENESRIPCEVLMLLWDKSKFEVEDIMLNFEKKSISSKEYDSQKKSYLYSIPVILVDFLKYNLTARNEESVEKDLHIRFVNKYREKCGGQWHELKDDGYFHFYIGYHLHKSGQHDLFKLFLDLRFIGEKIRIAGPADVLIDLRKYKEFIVIGGDEDKKELWEQIREFTMSEGHRIYGQDDVDVLQLALIVPGLKLIKHQAQFLIQSDTNHLYIKWTNSKSNQRLKPENNYVMNDIVHCLKFVAADFFVVGLNSGLIQLWKLAEGACLHEFTGHKDAVKCLDVFSSDSLSHPHHQQNGHNRSSRRHIFVSSSDDKSCKLWDLKTIMEEIKRKESPSASNETLNETPNSPSPKLHQKLYTFSSSSLRDKSILSFDFHTAPVSCVEISLDGSQIVSSSCNELLVWSSTNGQVMSKISSSPEAPFGICKFLSSATDFMLVSSENQVCLLVPKRPSIQSRIEGHHMKIVAMLFRNESSFITVSENEVGVWNISQVNRNEREKRVLRGPLQSLPINVTHVNGHGNGSMSNGESHKKLQPTLSSGGGGGGNYGDFLEPVSLHIHEKSNSNSSRSSKEWSVSYKNFSGISSSSSKSDCYSLESKPVTTFVDIGSYCIQILRENVCQRKKEGLFLCAALCDSNNGELLACGTTDHKIVLCELSDLTFVYEFNGHNGWVTAITFSPVESLTLLTGSDDQLVRIWDGNDWGKMEAEPIKTTVFASVVIDDGLNETKNCFLSLFATDRQTIQAYKDSKIFGESKCLNSAISVVSLCNDGSAAAVGTRSGRIFSIKNLLQHSNSEFVSSPGKNKNAFIPTLDVEQLGSPNATILSLEFNSNNEFLAAGTTEQIVIFKSFFPHWIVPLESPVVNLHFSYATTLTICLQNGSIKVENVENKVHLKGWIPEVSELKVFCSSLSLDSKTLVVGTSDDGILIFDISEFHGVIDSNFKKLSCKHNSQIRSLAISSDKQKLAVGHENGLITIWDLSVDPFLESRNLVLHKSCVRSIDFAKIKFYGDALWLVSSGDQLALWSLEKPEEKIKKSTFMEERRRRKSGESRPSSRLSLQVPIGQKIGRKGKRELLQSFPLRGKWAQKVVSNVDFTHFVLVDDTGVFYLLQSMENL